MNSTKHNWWAAGLALSAFAAVTSGCDRPSDVPKVNPNVTASRADNTAQNSAVREGSQSTPLDQSERPADIKITAAIRRALVEDSAMSMNAKNCKVMTDGGTVTLEGVVDTQSEKDSIESKARTVAGVTTVINRLEVKRS